MYFSTDNHHPMQTPDFSKTIQNIEKAANSILKDKTPDLFEISKDSPVQLTFVDDKTIQDLNATYRNKSTPTDVLSWSFLNQDFQSHEVAGEIYVSLDTATYQASQKKQSLEDRVTFLIVHGLLHVFGYDHNTDSEEAEMDQVTAQIIEKTTK